MKLHLLTLIILTSLLVACNEASEPVVTETVHLPAYLFDGLSKDEIISQGITRGALDVSISSTGVVSYEFSKETLSKRMTDVKNELQQMVESIIYDETYSTIRNISYEEDFSKFIVIVHHSFKENDTDRNLIIDLCKKAGEYQPYLAKESWTITAKIIDDVTVETIEIIKINENFEIIN